MLYSQILIEARALIADPANWTTKAFARNDKGNAVTATGEQACKFCAVGAIRKVLGSDNYQPKLYQLWSLLDDSTGADGLSIAHINDSRGHLEVLQAYDRAIDKAKQWERGT
jgi:hypothetical protein